MKLYRFEDTPADFSLLPLAARRALDHAGKKLSLENFRRLSLDARRALTEAGSGDTVALDEVRRVLDELDASPPAVPARADPDASLPPAALVEALGHERPLPDGTWRALTSLDRYALVKAVTSRTPGRLDAAYQEIVGESAWSSHLGPEGGVRMVRVTEKEESKRRAVAESAVTMNERAFSALAEKRVSKGDVLGTARVAAILGAKKTSDLIPLCHPLALTHLSVDFELDRPHRRLRIVTAVETTGPTGVEMEALVAASTAALTVYDMLKSLDRAMSLGPTRLLEKSGGASGAFHAASGSNDGAERER